MHAAPRPPAAAGLALALLAALAPGAAAQETSAPHLRTLRAARALALEAQERADEGDLPGAIDLVQLELDSGGDAQFEGVLAFTLGWLEWRLAGEDPEQRDELLERAAESYRMALDVFPSSAQARENLALVEQALGNQERAADLLADAYGAAREELPQAARVQGLLLLGDLERDRGAPGKALEAYEAALEVGGFDSAAARRIVELHASGAAGALGDERLAALPSGGATDRALKALGGAVDVRAVLNTGLLKYEQVALLAICREAAAAGHDGLALEGLETLLARAGDPFTRALVPEALELWARLEARRGTFGEASLARLPAPAEGEPAALAQLRASVREPLAAADVSAWTGTPQRRGALVAVLGSLARQRERGGDLAGAVAVRERAIGLALPLLHGEARPEDRFVALDLALEQAALLSAYPRLDPDGARFARLEGELLHEKNAAYGEQDLEAMERFHTVLGLIYAGRGAWEGDGWRAAPYHLQRAVDTARRRAERAGTPEAHPLPHLTRRLAQGLLEARGEPEAALASFADAARGFAQAGDTVEAAALLGEARGAAARVVSGGEQLLRALEEELRASGVRVAEPRPSAPTDASAPREAPAGEPATVPAEPPAPSPPRAVAPPVRRGEVTGWYLGVAAGWVSDFADEGALQQRLRDLGFNEVRVDLEAEDLGLKAYVGYRLERRLALELAWVDLGEVESDVRPGGGTHSALRAALADLHPYSARGVALGLLVFLYAGPYLEVFVEAGGWWWEARSDVRIANAGGGVDLDRDGFDPFYGAGLQVPLGRSWRLRLGAERYEVDDGEDIDLLAVGLQYGF